MGYQVNIRRKRHDGLNGWKLKWQKDFGHGKREQRHVSKKSAEFRELGFQTEMTVKEARARAKGPPNNNFTFWASHLVVIFERCSLSKPSTYRRICLEF